MEYAHSGAIFFSWIIPTIVFAVCAKVDVIYYSTPESHIGTFLYKLLIPERFREDKYRDKLDYHCKEATLLQFQLKFGKEFVQSFNTIPETIGLMTVRHTSSEKGEKKTYLCGLVSENGTTKTGCNQYIDVLYIRQDCLIAMIPLSQYVSIEEFCNTEYDTERYESFMLIYEHAFTTKKSKNIVHLSYFTGESKEFYHELEKKMKLYD